jgi:hypothetical protein
MISLPETVGAPEIQKGCRMEGGRAPAFPLYFSCKSFTFRANVTSRAKPVSKTYESIVKPREILFIRRGGMTAVAENTYRIAEVTSRIS